MVARPKSDIDDNRLPCVPFVPFRCPRCGRHKPRTSNVRGRLRQHICQACGQDYRSWELGPDSVPGWTGRPPENAEG